jgi:hypothetical protein
MHDRAIQAMRRASHASRGTWAARPSERGNVPATWDRRVRRCSSGFRRCFLPVSAAVSRPTRHDTTDPNDPFLSLSGLQKSTCRDVCCVERAIGDRSKRCKMLVLSRTPFFLRVRANLNSFLRLQFVPYKNAARSIIFLHVSVDCSGFLFLNPGPRCPQVKRDVRGR